MRYARPSPKRSEWYRRRTMADPDAFRERTRAVWAAGDWDRFSRLVAPVGETVLERCELTRGMELLDVGTGSGGTVSIPAALRGAKVVGADITPELLEHARRRAAAAGVEVEWVEADAQDLPFGDASFDRVISTFGAMFAPDHRRAAAELVRVCRPGGRILMATWLNDGFAGELFKLTGSFMPPPPAAAQVPPLWGVPGHATDMFAAAGAQAVIARESVVFAFPSVAEAVRVYADDFGPFVTLRRALEPQGRWDEFAAAFTTLVERFDTGGADGARIRSDYLLVTVER
jgi:SAM-dependent methyltransferase